MERRKEIEKIILEELPRLLTESPAFRHQLIGLMAEVFVRKDELKQVLDAIRELREDFNRGFEEHSKRIEELSRRQEEHSRELRRLGAAIGGLGARWGMMSEETFREGLKGILREFGLKVERYSVQDTEGYVLGHPEQIELDIVIKDKVILLLEIKSSISKEEVYMFQRKVDFYEKSEKVKVQRKAVLSPFVDPRARAVAEKLNIEVYTSAYDVKI